MSVRASSWSGAQTTIDGAEVVKFNFKGGSEYRRREYEHEHGPGATLSHPGAVRCPSTVAEVRCLSKGAV